MAHSAGCLGQRPSQKMPHPVKFDGRPVWAEIDLNALSRNLCVIKNHVNHQVCNGNDIRRKVLAVVKADAYGLGAVPVATALEVAGADWFGVTCPKEGVQLREAGIRLPILLMTGFWPGEGHEVLEYGLTPAISHCEQLPHLERIASRLGHNGGRTVGVHLKINTGMNRLGISCCEIERFARTLADCPHLKLEGTFTHFASSEDFEAVQTEHQERQFSHALQRLRELGFNPGLVHMANSAAIVGRPTTWADMVRPGAALYGYHLQYNPSDCGAALERSLTLEPSLSLRARIISLRDVPDGEGIGYNARFQARRQSRIAVLAAGYADGLPRGLSNRGQVIIREKFAPLVGTISMDLSTVDVTDVPDARVGDVATIFGSDGPITQLASDVARDLGTVVQDVLCGLGKRVPRFYLQ